ncbi:hypothetical protein [Pontibacter flavimaris]|nr:hypothetical protein [Pontibacter flavimaris]
MNRPDSAPILLLLGTVLLIGAAAYLLVNNSFDEKDFEFDTYDEESADYL